MGLLQLVSLSSGQPSVALENTTPPASSRLFGKIPNSGRCDDAHCPFKPSGGWEAWGSPMKVGRGECKRQAHLSPPWLSDQHVFVLLIYRAELLYQLGRRRQQKISNHWMHKEKAAYRGVHPAIVSSASSCNECPRAEGKP